MLANSLVTIILSFCSEKSIAQEEKNAEDPDERADFAMPAGADLDECEGQHAEAEARGDAEGERGGHQGEESGEGFTEIIPADLGDGAAHERADEDERGRGGVRRNGGDQRRAEHGGEKQRGDDDVAEAGAGAGGDPGGAFDVAGDRGGPRERADHGAEGVGEQGAAGAREFAVTEKAALFADADQGADVVEEIDEEENEDELAEADFCGAAEIELEERARGMRQREKMIGPMREAEGDAGQGDGQDAEENGAADPAGHQDGDEQQANGSEKNLRVGSLAESHEGGGVCDDDFGVAEAHEGDEQADARGGAVFQGVWNAVYDLLADVGEREDQKEQAGEEDYAEGGRPGTTGHDKAEEAEEG